MEITNIDATLLSCKIPEDNQWKLGGINTVGQKGLQSEMVVVQVETDEGITGLGEPAVYAGARRIEKAVQDIQGNLIGSDPYNVDIITDPSYHSITGGGAQTQDRWRGSRAQTHALAAVNMACWDIMGKSAGEPVAKLLGGKHADRVRVYASGGINWEYAAKPELLVDEAESYLDDGFSAFKFRIGYDERFVNAIKQVHEAFGDELDLLLEGNMRFRTPSEAVKIIEKVAQTEPYWFEEPLSLNDLQGYIDLREAIPNVPISGGESGTSVRDIKDWIERRAFDIVQPDCTVMGISEAKRVAQFAESHNLLCCPHNWLNCISTAANLHLAASIPNHDLLEMQQTWHSGCPAFREDIAEDPLVQDEGYLEVPDKPGLGISLDQDVLNDYSYEDGDIQTKWTDNPF